jgi:EmrB/QacA subfamily drug resistance transporter
MTAADIAEPSVAPRGGHTFCPPASRRFVLVSAILASSMGFIDGSVVSLAMPAIRADLSASLIDGQWIANSYMLFLSALVLIGGAAGDVFGVRNIFATGILVFMATSMLCAIATDADMLIAMRALQGIGAALMVPGSLAIIAKAYPPETRGAAIGTWAAFSSLTTAGGPFIGGMVLSFGDDWMWRLIFAINVPIGLAALAMLYLRVPQDVPSERRRLDVPGAVLATASLGMLAWGLTNFGLPAEQQIVPPLAWLAGGVLAAILFIGWERRTEAPMVKLGLFRSKAFSGANVYTLAIFLGFSGIVFFFPMTVVSAWGVSELEASLIGLPLSLSIFFFSGMAGRYADRVGPKLPLTIGALLMTVSYALLAATMDMMALWTVTFPIMLLQGAGMAFLVSPLSAAVMLATPDADTGLASGVNNAVARAAGLMAVAGLGALAGIVFASVMAGGAPGAEFGVAPDSSLAPELEAVRIAASNRAFQAIAVVSAVLCLAGAAIAWFTQPSKILRRD